MIKCVFWSWSSPPLNLPLYRFFNNSSTDRSAIVTGFVYLELIRQSSILPSQIHVDTPRNHPPWLHWQIYEQLAPNWMNSDWSITHHVKVRRYLCHNRFVCSTDINYHIFQSLDIRLAWNWIYDPIWFLLSPLWWWWSFNEQDRSSSSPPSDYSRSRKYLWPQHDLYGVGQFFRSI